MKPFWPKFTDKPYFIIKSYHPTPWWDSISRHIAPVSRWNAETIPLDHAPGARIKPNMAQN
jgi:hypothetical protein